MKEGATTGRFAPIFAFVWRHPVTSIAAIGLAAVTLGGWLHDSPAGAARGGCKRNCGPTAPAGLTVTSAGASALAASWSASSDRNGTVVGYQVAVNGGSPETVAATSTTVTELTCGTSYSVTVAAVDDSGAVSPAAAGSGSTGACPVLQPPTGGDVGIWQPKPGTTWQWQITGVVDTSVEAQMFDIDLFDAQPSAGTAAEPTVNPLPWVQYPQAAYVGPTITPSDDSANPDVIAALHAEGVKVICYMDSGAWESYRPDAALFPAAVIGKSTGWSGERWLDIRKVAWPEFEWIIVNRMLLAKASGCDGIEPDQNNPVGNAPGFPISYADEKAWYLEVARDAHALGLSVGMKNGIEIIDADLVGAFDWALNEQCFQYDECGALAQFVSAGKAVFQTEYQGDPATFCPQANELGFSSIMKHLDLDAWRTTCW